MPENTTEGTQQVGTEGDSSVISELRSQLKAAQNENKTLREAQEASTKARRSATESLLMEAGFPKLTDVILDRVEGFPTNESVNAALVELGLQPAPSATETPASAPQVEEQSSAADIAGVANLGQRVASAASGTGTLTVDEQLANAKSAAEIEAIMTKAGLIH